MVFFLSHEEIDYQSLENLIQSRKKSGIIIHSNPVELWIRQICLQEELNST